MTFKIFVVLTLGSTERQLAQLAQAAGTQNPIHFSLIQPRLSGYGFPNKYGLAVLTQPGRLPWYFARAS